MDEDERSRLLGVLLAALAVAAELVATGWWFVDDRFEMVALALVVGVAGPMLLAILSIHRGHRRPGRPG